MICSARIFHPNARLWISNTKCICLKYKIIFIHSSCCSWNQYIYMLFYMILWYSISIQFGIFFYWRGAHSTNIMYTICNKMNIHIRCKENWKSEIWLYDTNAVIWHIHLRFSQFNGTAIIVLYNILMMLSYASLLINCSRLNWHK